MNQEEEEPLSDFTISSSPSWETSYSPSTGFLPLRRKFTLSSSLPPFHPLLIFLSLSFFFFLSPPNPLSLYSPFLHNLPFFLFPFILIYRRSSRSFFDAHLSIHRLAICVRVRTNRSTSILRKILAEPAMKGGAGINEYDGRSRRHDIGHH